MNFWSLVWPNLVKEVLIVVWPGTCKMFESCLIDIPSPSGRIRLTILTLKSTTQLWSQLRLPPALALIPRYKAGFCSCHLHDICALSQVSSLSLLRTSGLLWPYTCTYWLLWASWCVTSYKQLIHICSLLRLYCGDNGIISCWRCS